MFTSLAGRLQQQHEVLLSQKPYVGYAANSLKIRIYYFLSTFVIVKYYGIILHEGSLQNQPPAPGYRKNKLQANRRPWKVNIATVWA